MSGDDGELIQRYLDGDADAFDALARRHAPALLAHLTWRTRDRAAAEDLLQETFLRALAALPAYRHAGRFRGWLLRIAGNLATDRARRAAIVRTASLEDPIAPGDPQGLTWGETLAAGERGDPERAAEAAERSARLRRALEAVNPLQREVVLLRLAEVPFSEIARRQRCSINTALGRMHDAVEALRKRMGEDER